MSNTLEITFDLNGTATTATIEPHERLRDTLRRLGMKSVKFGSETGETGAGAVLLDGALVSADVVLSAQADGHAVTTVEALNTDRDLHPIQLLSLIHI